MDSPDDRQAQRQLAAAAAVLQQWAERIDTDAPIRQIRYLRVTDDAIVGLLYAAETFAIQAIGVEAYRAWMVDMQLACAVEDALDGVLHNEATT